MTCEVCGNVSHSGNDCPETREKATFINNGFRQLDPPFIAKKEDPGRPTITCSIGPHVFHNAFYDLGESINIMSKVTYDKTLGGPLSTADFRLEMADQTL